MLASSTLMKTLLAIFLFLAAFSLGFSKELPLLQREIDATKSKNRANASPEKLKAYAEGIDAVAEAGIVEKALTSGDKAPDFTLSSAMDEKVTLSEELKKGPVVLTWYRGGWCPYCNIQLAAYQRILPQIEELGGQLIAVSPELPDKSLSTTEKNGLRFKVLSDVNLDVAREYGLVFELTPEVAELYSGFFSMEEYNGTEANSRELPLAATYVIGEDGKVAYAFAEADYTLRAEPSEILDALDGLRGE